MFKIQFIRSLKITCEYMSELIMSHYELGSLAIVNLKYLFTLAFYFPLM